MPFIKKSIPGYINDATPEQRKILEQILQTYVDRLESLNYPYHKVYSPLQISRHIRMSPRKSARPCSHQILI